MDRGQIQAKVHLAGGAQPAGRNEEWPRMTLGAVADIKTGATPSTQVPQYWNGTIPWCIPTDITGTPGKYLLTTERTITEEGLNSCGASLLPTGSLLLCSRATVGHVKIAASTVCTNQGFKSLICKDGTSNEFLYYLLLTLKSRIIQRATGSTFLEIARRDVASIEVLVPPLPEQRAIAEALSDVDDLLSTLEELITKKRGIKQAAMQQLLTGKTRLPGFTGVWWTKRLRDTCTFLPTGNNPRADLSDKGDVEYIHYGDIHAYARPVMDCTSSNLPRISRSRVGNAAELLDGDLVTVDASEDLPGVGKSIEVQGVSGRTIVAGLHTILCRGNLDAWATGFKAYLQFLPAFRSALARVTTGTSVYAISKKHLADVELQLPTPPEQEAIVSVLSDMDAEIAALEERRDKIDAIKQGMMQELLTGRVRLVKPDVVAEASSC